MYKITANARHYTLSTLHSFTSVYPNWYSRLFIIFLVVHTEIQHPTTVDNMLFGLMLLLLLCCSLLSSPLLLSFVLGHSNVILVFGIRFYFSAVIRLLLLPLVCRIRLGCNHVIWDRSWLFNPYTHTQTRTLTANLNCIRDVGVGIDVCEVCVRKWTLKWCYNEQQNNM